MSIKFLTDFAEDTLAGKCTKKTRRSQGQSLCHKFSLNDKEAAQSSKVEVLPGKVYSEDWLFGPASLLVSRSVIYPCSRFRCSIPCPCQDCQKLCSPSPCQALAPVNSPCNCCDCARRFKDHSLFHRTFHTFCKFCIQLVELFPNFKVHVGWFETVLPFYLTSWLNFKLLELSQYCKELVLLQILKVVKLKMKKTPNLTILKLNMVMRKMVQSK